MTELTEAEQKERERRLIDREATHEDAEWFLGQVREHGFKTKITAHWAKGWVTK